MNKDQILKLLKSVKYPGFNRDIVSFGMVPEVEPSGDSVLVKLKILSDQEDKIAAVQNEVRNLLQSQGGFNKVTIEMLADVSQPAAKPQADSDPFAGQGPLPGVKYVIAVASGKGGVGKTTVAANVAAALHQKGKRVGLLDLDIYGPSLPIVFGINERPPITEDKKLMPLDRYGIKIMSFGFISGNDAPAIWRGPMVAKMTDQFFKDVDWSGLDYLVLDLPPGTGDVQLTLVQKLKISGAVVVTTPQDIAVTDVSKGADMFRKVDVPVLGVIENMSGLQLSGTVTDSEGNSLLGGDLRIEGHDNQTIGQDGEFKIHIDLFKRGGGDRESRRLDVPLLGEIPLSQDLMEATDAGMPLVLAKPESAVSLIYSSIVDKLVATLEQK